MSQQFRAVADYFTDVVHNPHAKRKRTQHELHAQGPVKGILNGGGGGRGSSLGSKEDAPQGQRSLPLTVEDEGRQKGSGAPLPLSASALLMSRQPTPDQLAGSESMSGSMMVDSATQQHSKGHGGGGTGASPHQPHPHAQSGFVPVGGPSMFVPQGFHTQEEFERYAEESSNGVIYGTCFIERNVMDHFETIPLPSSSMTRAASSSSCEGDRCLPSPSSVREGYVRNLRASVFASSSVSPSCAPEGLQWAGGGLEATDIFKLLVSLPTGKTVHDITKYIFMQLLALKAQTSTVIRALPIERSAENHHIIGSGRVRSEMRKNVNSGLPLQPSSFNPILSDSSSYILLARGYEDLLSPVRRSSPTVVKERSSLAMPGVVHLRRHMIALALLYCDILVSVCDGKGLALRPLRRAVKNKKKAVDIHSDGPPNIDSLTVMAATGDGSLSDYSQSEYRDTTFGGSFAGGATGVSTSFQKQSSNIFGVDAKANTVNFSFGSVTSSSKDRLGEPSSYGQQQQHMTAEELLECSIRDYAARVLHARYITRELISSHRSLMSILKGCDLFHPPFLFSMGFSELVASLHDVMVDEARQRLAIENEVGQLELTVSLFMNMYHTDTTLRVGWYEHEERIRNNLRRVEWADRSDAQQNSLSRIETVARSAIEQRWKHLAENWICLEQERMLFACTAFADLRHGVHQAMLSRSSIEAEFDRRRKDLYAGAELASRTAAHIENVLKNLAEIANEAMAWQFNHEVTEITRVRLTMSKKPINENVKQEILGYMGNCQ